MREPESLEGYKQQRAFRQKIREFIEPDSENASGFTYEGLGLHILNVPEVGRQEREISTIDRP